MPTPNAKPARPTVTIDNDTVRVTEWRFPPGTATGFHRHEYPYVVVPITTGRLTIVAASGTTTAELRTGEPYFRAAGVEHDVVNDNDFEFIFIETEIK
jgi:quercetin dioxygenase-like cupin family protein